MEAPRWTLEACARFVVAVRSLGAKRAGIGTVQAEAPERAHRAISKRPIRVPSSRAIGTVGGAHLRGGALVARVADVLPPGRLVATVLAVVAPRLVRAWRIPAYLAVVALRRSLEGGVRSRLAQFAVYRLSPVRVLSWHALVAVRRISERRVPPFLAARAVGSGRPTESARWTIVARHCPLFAVPLDHLELVDAFRNIAPLMRFERQLPRMPSLFPVVALVAARLTVVAGKLSIISRILPGRAKDAGRVVSVSPICETSRACAVFIVVVGAFGAHHRRRRRRIKAWQWRRV